MTEKVIIVGAGIAGTILALKLADAQRSVLLIDAGSDRPVGDWRDGNWFDARFDSIETDTDYPYDTLLSRVKAFGGSCEAWEGYSYRLKADEFEMRSRYGMGWDWPFGEAEMFPYYRRAESLIGVAGDHAEFDRPHQDRAPIPAFPFERYENRIIDVAKSLNMSFLHVPQARNSVGYDHRRACLNLGVCNACPIGARWTPRTALHRRIMRHPKVRFLPDTICTEVLVSSSRKRCGIRIYSKCSDRVSILEADRIVLAGGTIENIRLVLHSERILSAIPPKAADSVGRGFMDHPVYRVAIKTSWRKHSRKRQTNILASCHDFRSFDLATNSPGFIINLNSRIDAPKALLAAHLEMLPHKDNRVTLGQSCDPTGMRRPKVCLKASMGIVQGTLSRAAELIRRLAAEIGSEPEEFPLQLWACHHMGGLRMGRDNESVLDRDLAIRNLSNVHVASLASIPTSSSVNPTLTLVALVLRMADKLSGIDPGHCGSSGQRR
jgi:choline dehydrogenase-like flavoprotein